MRANNRVIDQMEIQGLVPENDILNKLLVTWGKDNDFQFNDLDQAKEYAALGYVKDGDEVLIKSGDSWATHKLNSKKKTIATP